MQYSTPLVFFVTSLLYIGSSMYLVMKIKREGKEMLYPICVYLFAVSAFFILMGINSIEQSNAIVLIAAFSIVIGATTIARIPLLEIFQRMENLVYSLLLIGSFLAVLLFLIIGNQDWILRIAHLYAFLSAGIFTMGYLIYTGLKDPTLRDECFSATFSLILCAFAMHGLYVVGTPFTILNLNVGMAMVFAFIAPIVMMLMLYTDKFIKSRYKEFFTEQK